MSGKCFLIFCCVFGHFYRPQGNIFRSVCQEFCPQGGCLVGGVSGPRGACFGGGGCLLPGVSAPEGVSAPGGYLLGGCLLLGVPAPRGCLMETPLSRRLLLQAVRILLECILVSQKLNLEHSGRINA